MSLGLRDEMLNLKGKLENLEGELTNQMMELEVKAEEWHKKDEQVTELVKKNKDLIITLDVGGKKFQTKLETLLSYKDTLFYKIFLDGKLDLRSEIFIDRSYFFFHHILSYLRNKKLIDTSLSNQELEELFEDACFYEIQELIDNLQELKKEVKYISYEFSGVYNYSGRIAGSNKIEDLNNFDDRTLKNGICAVSPGWIIIELSREVEFQEIEIGGWNGDTSLWGASNGASAAILSSNDKNFWNTIGTIPTNFGASIITVKLTKTKAKYIKFNSNSYLGLGYFKIHKM
jgi:hypothetical protein